MKTFSLGAVLSVTTERLMADIGELYAILNYMTGDNLYTHQLPRVSRECRPFLLAQYPALADIDLSDVTCENWLVRLTELWAIHGKTLDVAPLPEHAHESIDPISELAEIVHPDKIIAVQL